jgi:hypothetical protein
MSVRQPRTSVQLYEPLQSTLDKSMISDPIIELQKSRVYERLGNPSRISKRLRSLSPQEAHHIVNVH